MDTCCSREGVPDVVLALTDRETEVGEGAVGKALGQGHKQKVVKLLS